MSEGGMILVDTGGTDMIDLQVKLTEKMYQKYGNALNMNDCSDQIGRAHV